MFALPDPFHYGVHEHFLHEGLLYTSIKEMFDYFYAKQKHAQDSRLTIRDFIP